MNIAIANRQRTKKINARLFRKILLSALAELHVQPDSEICFHLVAAPEMARINWQFLRHEGSTDVITFDNSKLKTQNSKLLAGEIFICLDDAVAQAKQFRTSWQSEVVRYAVHGVLHLLGHDDLRANARRKMKREENRMVRRLAKEFPLARLAR